MAKMMIYIDADNISPKHCETIIKKARSYGEILEIRVFSTSYMKNWRTVLANEPATYHRQPRVGKNDTDAGIILDVAGTVYKPSNIDVLGIATSDSDFCFPAKWLRENGKFVIGMGERKSPQSWQKACNEFILLKDPPRKEATGILIRKPKYFGLTRTDCGDYYFSSADVDGDIEQMEEGSQVTFKILKEPDPSQPEKKNQRGKASNVRLVA